MSIDFRFQRLIQLEYIPCWSLTKIEKPFIAPHLRNLHHRELFGSNCRNNQYNVSLAAIHMFTASFSRNACRPLLIPPKKSYMTNIVFDLQKLFFKNLLSGGSERFVYNSFFPLIFLLSCCENNFAANNLGENARFCDRLELFEFFQNSH